MIFSKKTLLFFIILVFFTVSLSSGQEFSLPGKGSLLKPKGAENPRPFTVVIDAGHGGEDKGAIGAMGTAEKDVTLKVGEMLKELLTERLGADVVLTRKDDESLSVAQRTALANKSKGDVFISIHTEAGFNPEKKGMTVYSFDSDYYKNVNPALLLAKESEVIFWDLAQYRFLNESGILAGSIFQSLENEGFSEQIRLKKAPLSVLKGLRMPGVVLGVGYLSNPEEEIKLKDVVTLTKIAEGIYLGLEKYREQKKSQ
jgi:N-acetylmuramoyl-L-alanine amidase